MRLSTLLAISLIAALTLFACNNSSEETNTSKAKETVTINITASNPDSTIVFEAINIGEWHGSAPADSQSTPFEFTVGRDFFFGTFHKLEGNSQMVFEIIGEKNGETTWETNKEYDRLAQIILNGEFTSVNGK